MPAPARADAGVPITILAAHVFASALLLYVATTGGSLSSSDAVVTFEVTRSLVERHTVALSANILGLEANRGVDGRYYSQYGIGQSLYNVPFYLAGRAIVRVTGLRVGKEDSVLKAAVVMGSAVAAAGTVTMVFLLAWLMVGHVRASVIAAAACGVGSLLWPYARLGFNAPLAAWLLISAVTCLYVGLQRDRLPLIALGGALVGAGILTRHEFAIVAIPLAIWLAFDTKRVQRLVWFLPGVAAGIGTWMLYNDVRFGSPLRVGYSPWFSTSGYVGLLFSPSGSLFLYSPTVVLGLIGLVWLSRRDTRAAWLLGAPALCLFLLYGSLDDWSGGRSYGPRYLVPVLPLLIVPIAYLLAISSRGRRRALVLVIAASAVLQLPGVLVDYSRVSESWARMASHDDLVNRQNRWSTSPLVLNTAAAMQAVPRTVAILSGRAQPPTIEVTASTDRHDFTRQFAFSVDFWWLYLFYLGVIRLWAARVLGLVLLTVAGLVAIRTWRLAHANVDGLDRRCLASSDVVLSRLPRRSG